MEIIKLIETIGTILIFLATGIVISKRGIVKEKDTKALTDIIIYIAIPALIISEIPKSLEIILIGDLYIVPIISFLFTLIILYFGKGIARQISSIAPHKEDVFALAMAFPNTVFVGLPLMITLYGNKVVGMVFFYDLGVNIVLYSLAISILKNEITSAKKLIKSVVNPPLIAIIIAIILYLLDIELPSLVSNALNMLGDTTIALSLLVVGIIIGSLKINLKIIDRSMIFICFLKLFISGFLMFVIVYKLNIDVLIKKILILEASMPTMVVVSILARTYNRDYRYAAMTVFLTTVLSIITIPIMVTVIEKLI
ncbi:AEC family transporter [Clostridiisalibacter paucivorans]|uniref:AEC family transporter n=1 Tax=Clostridiisalibacter paucivorans TaxID=408753 RepID=UPI00047A5843|nr:AEC family transporter [Clostridiisalibacter paucivorans]